MSPNFIASNINDTPSVISNITWDRTTLDGSKVQSGLYFLDLKVDFPESQESYSETLKVLVTD